MTTVLAIANQKGGTAKTTTAVHLAAALGERGVRTLLVDLDPQANASAWLGVTDDGQALLEAMIAERGDLAALAEESSAPGVDVVPASPRLAHAERELTAVPAGELVLSDLLGDLPRGRWRYILLDCPPQLGRLTTSALLATHGVLVPVEASALALAGLAALVGTVHRARRHNTFLHLTGVLACRVDYRNRISREVVAALRQRFPHHALDTVIRERVRLREAWSHRQPVTLYEPDGDAAEDYRALAAEILQRGDRHAAA